MWSAEADGVVQVFQLLSDFPVFVSITRKAASESPTRLVGLSAIHFGLSGFALCILNLSYQVRRI